MEKKREQWLDLIRGFIIICVVFEHARERVDVSLPLQSIKLDIIGTIIKTFQMSVLFSVSGYLYANRDRNKLKKNDVKSLKNFIYKKLWDLFIPYTIFGILIWFGKMLFSEWVKYQVSFTDLFLIYVKPISFAWFLYALFIFEVICAIFDYLFVKSTKILVAVSSLLTLLSCCMVDSADYLNKVMYYGFFFVLGILIYEYSWSANKKAGLVTSIVYILAFILYYLNQEWVLLFALCGVLFTVTAFLLVGRKAIKENFFINLIEFIGIQSIYIYILHPVIEHGVRMIFVEINFMQATVWLFALTIAGLFIPVIYYLLAKRIWILDLLFRPRRYLRKELR